MQTQLHVAVLLAIGPSQQLQKMLLWLRHLSEPQTYKWVRAGGEVGNLFWQ